MHLQERYGLFLSRFWQSGTLYNQPTQRCIKRVLRIRSVEPSISIGTAEHEPRAREDFELLLDGVERKEGKTRHLTHIQLLARVCKKQSQNLRPAPWKQRMQ